MKPFLFLVFSLIGFHSLAQTTEPRYIEFQVTDSVHMMPEKFIYGITLNRYNFFNNDLDELNTLSDDPTARVNEATQKMEQADARLQKLFRDMKLTPVNNTHTSAAYLTYQETVKTYTLEFRSEEALRKFETRLREIEKVSGYVSDMKVTEKQVKAARERLFAKIAARAKSEGEMMASKFNSSLGSVMSIKADPERLNGGAYNGYGMYGTEGGYDAEEIYPGMDNGSKMMQDMYMTVTVRYELK